MEDGALRPVNVGLGRKRHPHIGGTVGDAVSEKSRRSNARHGELPRLNGYVATNDGGVAAKLCLPGTIAQHDDGRCVRLVVALAHDAAGEGSETEGREV